MAAITKLCPYRLNTHKGRVLPSAFYILRNF